MLDVTERTRILDWRRAGLIAAGALLGATIAIGASTRFNWVTGTSAEFWLLATLALIAGATSFVTISPAGRLVVINPALCFTFAILLSWGFWPAVVTQTAAVVVTAARRRLPAGRAVVGFARFLAAFSAANAVLLIGSPDRSGSGLLWSDFRDAGTVFAAMLLFLAVYAASAVLLTWLAHRVRVPQIEPSPPRYQLLFSASLLALSPILSVTAQINVAFVPLMLLPLFAVRRMASLASERDRTLHLDALTGLANRSTLRRLFAAMTATSFERGAASAGRVALLLLDLDRFKHVNDSLGHDVGDQLLIAVARRLTAIEGSRQVVGRLGGDEFAILIKVPDPAAAYDVAQRVVAALRDPVSLEGLTLEVTASVGVAIQHNPIRDDFTAMLRHADAAMYTAKRRGDAIAVYDNAAGDNRPDRLRLLADFRQALESADPRELAILYQPQVRLATGTVEGFEALLRWTHPVLGPVDTTTIIDIAEHTAVMPRLTAWVINEVTIHMQQWAGRGLTPRISVNMSARDLHNDDIVAHLARQLTRRQLAPAQLQIEITESALMADPTRAQTTLDRIASLGISISLDDFGTGYSSLQHLRRLPLAELKIDQTFIATMNRNHDDVAIVTSTIDMAHALDLRTVAEGIPDEATRRLLSRLHCDLGQGWHTGYPMPATVVPAFYSGHSGPRPIQVRWGTPRPVRPAAG